MERQTKGRVLIVAGSDSGGGAGIQADIRTVTALGGYAMTAITALTAQNTLGVFGIHPVPAEFVAQQMRVVLEDIGADAIKIGMLGSADVVEAVADVLDSPFASGIPVVLDPVMAATRGGALLDVAGVAAMRRRLLPKTMLFTPNLPEAEVLTGMTIEDTAGMRDAAMRLCNLGPRNVLLKGGHLDGDELIDLLVGSDGRGEFRHARIRSRHTHGTGCVLSSAITTALARGLTVDASVRSGVAYIQAAIRTAPALGRGRGPLGLGNVVGERITKAP
jgi:hydroxymethylpyrimidine/phosphomethylpyrimidine kinase